MSRKEYLKELADEYGVPLSVVMTAASVLGPSEDHDGLITAIEDWLDMNG